MMFRAAYSAPSAQCGNPGLKPRGTSQVPLCNERPCDTYPSSSQVLHGGRRWPGSCSHHKEQLDHTLGWKTCPSVYMPAHHGLLISRHWESEGRELGLFSCFGNQNMQVTSFSSVSQRTCLGWLYGAAISINFLSFVSLCCNLHLVWVLRRDHWCPPEPFGSFFCIFSSILSKVKQLKYGQISKTSDTMQCIK